MKAFKCDRCQSLAEGNPKIVRFRMVYGQGKKWLCIFAGSVGDQTEMCQQCYEKLLKVLGRFFNMEVKK